MMVELPREAFTVALYTAIVYYIIGYDGSFLAYWITLFLGVYVGGSYGMFIGCLSDTTQEAAQLCPGIMIPQLIWADALNPVAAMPALVKWIAQIDSLYFLIRSFMLIEFSGTVYPVTWSLKKFEICNEYHNLNGSTVDEVFNAILNMTNCSEVVEDVLDHYNISINETDFLADHKNESVAGCQFDADNPTKCVDQWIDSDDGFGTTDANWTWNTTDVNHYEELQSLVPDINEDVMDEYCPLEQSAAKRWHKYGLDWTTWQLVHSWFCIVAHCVALRVVSMILLYVRRHGGFKAVGAAIKRAVCRRRPKVEVDFMDDAELEMEETTGDAQELQYEEYETEQEQ